MRAARPAACSSASCGSGSAPRGAAAPSAAANAADGRSAASRAVPSGSAASGSASRDVAVTDLANELEHVERAGLGQVHHDGAVHDEQAPATASSSHGACAGHNLVPQKQCSTTQMASKHATSSSSNAVVGQKVARSTAEPTSPYRRRHGRRERALQRRIASARISYLILSILS
mgnify:CR=1 FL=1|jgi:hypothetical protein